VFVIRSFGDKETEKIFSLNFSRKIPRDIQERAYHKLVAIHEAEAYPKTSAPRLGTAWSLCAVAWKACIPSESTTSGASCSAGRARTPTM
jgi:hypothetical protein